MKAEREKAGFSKWKYQDYTRDISEYKGKEGKWGKEKKYFGIVTKDLYWSWVWSRSQMKIFRKGKT